MTGSAAQTLRCEQDGCPFAESGKCLEGLPSGEGCPHLVPIDTDDADHEAAAAESPADDEPPTPDAAANTSPQEADPLIELGGDESLSLVGADEVAARYGAQVILIAGEFNAGKTTLIAHTYGQFLEGPFCGWNFAGSVSLIALDLRLSGARGPDGPPTVPHTVDEGMRLLDLRLSALETADQVSLLISDIKGEFVSHVIDGAPVMEELPLAARADKAAIVVDGSLVADPYERQNALHRARLLIGSLTDPSASQFERGRPMAIVLTKLDQLDDAGRAWFEAEAAGLRDYVAARGHPATVLLTAAEPAPPDGLSEFLGWLVDPLPTVTRVPDDDDTEHTRSYWRYANV